MKLLLAVACMFISLVALPQNKSCCRPPVFDIDSAGSPPLFTGIGNNVWPITTTSDSCQLYFNQAIRLNHCYNDFEAYRSFKKALSFDSTCAMCLWGMVISDYSDYDKKRDKASLQKALQLLNPADTFYHIQQTIIAATLDLKLIKNEKKCEKAFYNKLRPLIDEYPDNAELALFLCDNLSGGYNDDVPEKYQDIKLDLLQNVLNRQPDNFAAHHYYIHALENGPDVDSAVHSAQVVTHFAPGSPHILHMPGHVYFRNGNLEQALAAFQKSYNADTAYMARYNISPYNDWNYVHNLAFLTTTYIELGQLQALQPWLKLQENVPYIKQQKHSGNNYNNYQLSYGYQVWAYMRCHQWDSMIATSNRLSRLQFEDDGFYNNYFAAMADFGYFLKALENGQADTARNTARYVISNIDNYVKNGRRKYKKTHSYESLVNELYVYRIYAMAYLEEQNHNLKKAERMYEYLIDLAKVDYKSEPPQMLLSPFEWAIENCIRQQNTDVAESLLTDYNRYRKNSPFVAYYRFCITKASNSGNTEAIKKAATIALEQMKTMDHNLAIYKQVEDAAK